MSGSGAVSVVEPMVPPADVSAMRSRAGRGPSRRDRPTARSFRLPVVLCYFEGLTLDEAAHRLEWPAGTLRSRLARAREKLRRGLARRGLAAPAAALAVGLSDRSASAFVSSALCDITTRAAIHFAAGQAASSLAASLAQEVLRAMFVNKLKLIATTLLLLAAGATGAGYLSSRSREPGRAQTAARRSPAAGCGQVRRHKPASGPGSDVRRRPRARPPRKTGAQCDDDGLRGDQAAGARRASYREDDSRRRSARRAATARAGSRSMPRAPRHPGITKSVPSLLHRATVPAGSSSTPTPTGPTPTSHSGPSRSIQGRLFDLNGRPVQGVDGHGPVHGPRDPGGICQTIDEGIDGPSFWWNPGKQPAGLAQVGDQRRRGPIHRPRRRAGISGSSSSIDDPRFARQRIPIDTDGTSESKPVTLALEPAKIIKGRITDAGTGKPIPHAQVSNLVLKEGAGTVNEFEADAEGRFRANPLSADRYEVSVVGSRRAALPERLEIVRLAQGGSRAFDRPGLAPGVVIRGKVTEEGSGKPVAGARISFTARRAADDQSGAWNGRAASGPDGSFQLAVLPGPGYLVVLGPSDDYVLREENGDRRRSSGAAGWPPLLCPRLHRLRPEGDRQEPGGQRRASPGHDRDRSGRRAGGQPIQDAWMISRVFLEPSPGAWLLWSALHHGSVKSGRFEVHGLDPDAERPRLLPRSAP